MKAKAAGMEVQDYLTDRIDEEKIENSNKEVQFLEESLRRLCRALPTARRPPWTGRPSAKPGPRPTSFTRSRGKDSTICARFDENRDKIVLVKNKEAYGIRPRNDEQKFALDACLNPAIQLVSMTGGAGTGKTLLALAAAIEQAKDFDQIILTRPTIVLGNQDIGFIPGDQKAKMSPFIQPLMDNLNVIKAQFRPSSKEALRIEAMLKEEKLLISPLAYIRGRSLGRVFLICDEAQNLTPNEVKTIITRAGEGTKMVFTGDIFQIDQPYLDQWSNGLSHLNEKMDGQRAVRAHIPENRREKRAFRHRVAAPVKAL